MNRASDAALLNGRNIPERQQVEVVLFEAGA